MFDNFIFKKKGKKCLIKNLHSIKMSKEAGNTSILKGILQNGLAYQGITNQLENHENYKRIHEKKEYQNFFFILENCIYEYLVQLCNKSTRKP